MSKIVIGGIGNVLLGDDGVGPCVAAILEARYEFNEHVSVIDLGTPGLDLVAHLSGIDAVILIDSVANGAAPGTVTLYRREDILRNGPAPVRMDPHSPALSESLLIADLAGQGPKEILLAGITGEQYESCSTLSQAVLRGAAHATDEVLRELDRLGVGYRERSAATHMTPWWSPVSCLPAESSTI